jgi:ATP-binding cassette subfamily F protein uup
MPSDITVGDALLGVKHQLEPMASPGKPQGIYDVVRNYRIALNRAEQYPEAFTKACASMDSSNAWSVLTKAEEIATKLRVQHLSNQPLSSLSGGERKRIALAAALIQEPDVLLLDEPTNHLDLAAIQWLSDLILENKKLTVLVVTHDRAFLELVCDTILELDRGSLYSYPGNYAAFLEAKEARLALEDAAVQAAKAKYRVELDWMRRQPQARETKAKARIEAFYKLEKATKPRSKDPNLTLNSADQRRLGGNIMKLKDVSLAFGPDKILLDSFSYDFIKGDRIGIVGRNGRLRQENARCVVSCRRILIMFAPGVGKSTFIRILSGAQQIDSGHVEPGETIVLGVYDQMGLEITRDDMTVIEFVMDEVKDFTGAAVSEAPERARKLLKQFEFPRQRWNERVTMLSGGERRRLQLLSVLSKNPNFLILDEPSNDLDINSIAALEDYLRDFKGVLVVVSHDKFFTDKVTDHLFVFEGNGVVKDYLGSLSEYAECLIEQENSSYASSDSSYGLDQQGKTTSYSYKEDKAARNERQNSLRKLKKEMSSLETSMEKLKSKIAQLQEEIDSSSEEGWSVLAELTDKLNQEKAKLEEKEFRWLEVAEEIEYLDQVEV